MNAERLAEQISLRTARHGLVVSESSLLACGTYLSELARWNQRVNLTALPLDFPIPDATIDKLIVEPLIATSILPAPPRVWIDLGSGGGSPAVPLRTMWRGGSLTMVESRTKKCSFLREVVRQLGLSRTKVEEVRFEVLHAVDAADLATIRAVRIDEPVANLLASLTCKGGYVLAFGSTVSHDSFVLESITALPDDSSLNLFRRAKD